MEDEKFEEWVLDQTDAKSVKFTGRFLGSGFTTADRNHKWFSGDVGRSTILELYQTKGGKYVCLANKESQWQSEHGFKEVEICETIEAVKKYFGHCEVAKRLYIDANIITPSEQYIEID